MTGFHSYARTALAIALLALGACSSATSAGRSAPPDEKRDDAWYVAKARADSARLPYTAADIHFMSAMIGHHAQAIEMSKLAPTNGAGAAVQRLAERIINAQADEITTMQTWLKDRLQPVPEAKGGPMKMMMNGMEHMMLMPGMLSDEQMKKLAAARGQEFDRLFLSLMIQHHRGAVGMVKELFESPGGGQDDTIFKLASDVNVDQVTEIARMEQLLAAIGATKPAP